MYQVLSPLLGEWLEHIINFFYSILKKQFDFWTSFTCSLCSASAKNKSGLLCRQGSSQQRHHATPVFLYEQFHLKITIDSILNIYHKSEPKTKSTQQKWQTMIRWTYNKHCYTFDVRHRSFNNRSFAMFSWYMSLICH